MKKFLSGVLAVCFSFSLIGCFGEGGCFIGDHFYGNGYKTIERAWKQQNPNTFDSCDYEYNYDVAKLYFEGGAVWFYVTKEGYLVEADFEYANGGWWSRSYGNYGKISDLEAWFQDLDADKTGFSMLPGTKVLLGIRIHDGQKVVANGVESVVNTYTISYEESQCLLDVWYIEDFESAGYEDIEITYKAL